MSERQIRESRYERKFLVDQLDAHQVRAMVKLHPSMFYEPYPPRYVNNLYLDTEGMENYLDNVSGVGERRKVRIRWYGDLFRDIEKPMLEFKIKNGLVGTKHIYPFAPFTLDGRFCHRYYQEILRKADLPDQVKHYVRGLNVVLCNRYYRWYFATKDQRFRVTIDTEMTFYQVKKVNNRFVHKHVDYSHIVVEMKYQKPLDVQADRVSGFFPFSVTKNSKYVTGIERVYL
jgi:SPX domain protein involved in polyphosphate accumulation